MVAEAARLKKKKGMSGVVAYIAGVFTVLIKKYGLFLTVQMDQKQEIHGEMLLCAVANGGFCGGGFHSALDASVNDGYLNAYLIHKVNRFKFLTLLGKYRTGTYIHIKNANTFLDYACCTSIKIRGNEPVTASIDGEIFTYPNVEIHTVSNAISFSVPKGCVLLNDRQNNEEELSWKVSDYKLSRP